MVTRRLIAKKNVQFLDLSDWLDNVLSSERGLEFGTRFEESLYGSGLRWPDVRHVLRNPAQIAEGYGRNCHVITGTTVDGYDISVAVVLNFRKNRLKVIKTWRNK